MKSLNIYAHMHAEQLDISSLVSVINNHNNN